jgi:hypothetical protein
VFGHIRNDLIEADAPARHRQKPGILAAEEQEPLGQAREPLELFQLILEHSAVLLGIPWHSQGHFGFVPEHCQRRA